MALNHTHKAYENYVLAAHMEDQLDSKLDLLQFCTVDNSLVGVAGDKKIVRVYSASNGTEKLAMGDGNTKNIEATYDDVEYKILLAQNRTPWYDEELMKDPMVVETALNHAAVDMANTIQADVYAEFAKATLTVHNATFSFANFIDAVSLLDYENIEGVEMFAFVHKDDMAAIRKALKDDLKYVEDYVRKGYVGTIAGVNLFVKDNAERGVIYGGTKEAVTMFHKTGVEVEQQRDANVRLNEAFSRKYYVAALTDAGKCFKITTAAE